MKRAQAFCVITGVLLACSCHPEMVQVPVAVPCPPPPAVQRPHLPIAELKPASPANQVMRAYAASVEVLKGYALQLEKLLDGYRGGRDGQ